MVRVAAADASERYFQLSSIANPAQSVEPHETALIIFTVTRSAEVLLTVRFYGQTQFRATRGLRAQRSTANARDVQGRV
ncbi:MAG: hypothetical protein ACHQC8_03575 [Solirubrobacterales bacterium]